MSITPSQAPVRPTARLTAATTATTAAALLTLVALGTWSGHLLLIPPMAASAALIAGTPVLPPAQPRSVVGGQLISATVGVLIGLVSHSLVAAAIAGAMALGAMLLTRTSHPPAVATGVLGTLTTAGQVSFVICVGLASVILVAVGAGLARLGGPVYPAYWW